MDLTYTESDRPPHAGREEVRAERSGEPLLRPLARAMGQRGPLHAQRAQIGYDALDLRLTGVSQARPALSVPSRDSS